MLETSCKEYNNHPDRNRSPTENSMNRDTYVKLQMQSVSNVWKLKVPSCPPAGISSFTMDYVTATMEKNNALSNLYSHKVGIQVRKDRILQGQQQN